MSFVNVFKSEAAEKHTENGALAWSTTQNPVLDLFGEVGAMRDRSEEDIKKMFDAAFEYDADRAIKLALYVRDIRGCGCGERRTGRILLSRLADLDPDTVCKNMQTFVDNGRADDIIRTFSFRNDVVEIAMWSYCRDTLQRDMNEEHPSLLAKWMPSINASSEVTKSLGKRFIQFINETSSADINLSVKDYRKMLAKLRAKLDIVERKMSHGEWDLIEFNKVPSYAMKQYVNCFKKHQPERYKEYISKLKTGEEKINSSVLFPYDIVRELMRKQIEPEIADAQWKSLPDYFNGEEFNCMCLVDTSWSMLSGSSPLYSAIGMGIYFAQHNRGDWHNLLMTFSDDCHIHTLNDSCEFHNCLDAINTGDCASTNLQSALEKTLRLSLKAAEAPQAIVIMSDQEIDPMMNPSDEIGEYDSSKSLILEYKKLFEKEGFVFPTVVFWQMAARNDTFLAPPELDCVRYISGVSAAQFSNLKELLTVQQTPYDVCCMILDKYSYN